jgi:hypothetical protein
MSWRERFREDNELLLRVVGNRWLVQAYLYIAVLTVASQVTYRWDHCSGTLNCSLSFLKAFVWATVWPIYWVNYATDFVLLRPYG